MLHASSIQVELFNFLKRVSDITSQISVNLQFASLQQQALLEYPSSAPVTLSFDAQHGVLSSTGHLPPSQA
jgi:hypothetical protein